MGKKTKKIAVKKKTAHLKNIAPQAEKPEVIAQVSVEPVAEAATEPVVEAVEEVAAQETVVEAVEEVAAQETVVEAVEEVAAQETTVEAVEEVAAQEAVAEPAKEPAPKKKSVKKYVNEDGTPRRKKATKIKKAAATVKKEEQTQKLSKSEMIIEVIRKLIFSAALGAFVYAATGLIIYGWSYYSSGQEYKDLNGGVNIEPETIAEEEESQPQETQTDASGEIIVVPQKKKVPKINFSVDEEYFSSINSDYMCYMYIPGETADTSLKYPVVLGEDNEHYLRYTYKNTENMAGAIFMDFRTTRDDPFSSFSTVICGHDRKDGSMFGYLLKYKDESYANRYPYIYIYRGGNISVYEVYAFYEHVPYGLCFSPKVRATDLIPEINELNWYTNDIEVTGEDKILTLYTCTEDTKNRYLLHAVLRDTYAAK